MEFQPKFYEKEKFLLLSDVHADKISRIISVKHNNKKIYEQLASFVS